MELSCTLEGAEEDVFVGFYGVKGYAALEGVYKVAFAM
jgi:hypothetical protein